MKKYFKSLLIVLLSICVLAYFLWIIYPLGLIISETKDYYWLLGYVPAIFIIAGVHYLTNNQK